MAGKARAGKLENTIEQCRNEGKWQKSIELAEELRSNSPVHGKLKFISMFLYFLNFILQFQRRCQVFSSAKANSRVFSKRTHRLKQIFRKPRQV